MKVEDGLRMAKELRIERGTLSVGFCINENGKCIPCGIKPLKYTGRVSSERQYFCHRCDRSYNLDTGEQRPNWAWELIGPNSWRKK